jgi:hypothetical protein
MGAILLLLFAEMAISTALSYEIRKRREAILKKWIEGSLTEQELRQLKKAKWFRSLWKPTLERVSFSKKNN